MALWLLFRAGPKSSSRFLVAAINRPAGKGRTVHHQRPLTTKLKANIKYTCAAILHWRLCLHSSWEETGDRVMPNVVSCNRAEERYSNDLNRVKWQHGCYGPVLALWIFHTLICVFVAQVVVLIVFVILCQHPLLAFVLGMYLRWPVDPPVCSYFIILSKQKFTSAVVNWI